MPTYKRFEELPVWQLARQQCSNFFPFLKSEAIAADRALQSQMNRSSASVMDNIAEGFDRHSRSDFRHFLVMARGSNAELRSQFYRCADRHYLSETEMQPFRAFNVSVGAQLQAFIQYLDKANYANKPKGTSYLSEPDALSPAAREADFFSLLTGLPDF